MIKTITRQQVGMFLAFNNNEDITNGENELLQNISPELANKLKEIEKTVLEGLANGETEWTYEIPDELIPEWMKETNDEEDEIEEEQ